MSRKLFPLVPLLLLSIAWYAGHREGRRGPLVQPVLTALVLPQLSLECVGSIGRALRICSSPSPRAAMVCGVALVQVLYSCP